MSNRQQRRAAGKEKPATLADARALAAAGRAGEAFAAFEALRATKPTPAVLAAFGEFLIGNTPAAPHPVVDALFVAALDEAWLRPEAMAPAIATYLLRKSPEALTVARDPLLHALLRATPAATPALEAMLSQARAALLAAYRAGQRIEAFVPFLAALAEREMVSGFALTGADAPPAPVDLPSAALAATYAPLTVPVPWPELAGVVAAQIEEPAREAGIAIPAITTIGASNAAVAAHYEDAPYPRWRREPMGAAPRPPVDPARVRSVLVAGCGTGQHALLAADRWPRADLLAIDLSRASLAYAVRQSGERGRRIAFAQGDLLAIGDLGRRFDAIEAVGVLHHLADPEAGLAALRDVLAPRGVMLIALYSRAARARLTGIRERTGIAHATTADDIRVFRARALALGNMPELLYSPDFYSVGGCRDLVLHAREHSYDLGEIAAMLDRAGLRALALDPPRVMPPKPPRADDLVGWTAAEAAQPLLFGAMYHLWVTRRKGD